MVSLEYLVWLTNTFLVHRREISIPLMEQTVLGGRTTFDSCSMYDIDYEYVLRNGLRPNSTWKTKPCSSGWDYDLEQIRYHSAVTEVSFFYSTNPSLQIFPCRLFLVPLWNT